MTTEKQTQQIYRGADLTPMELNEVSGRAVYSETRAYSVVESKRTAKAIEESVSIQRRKTGWLLIKIVY
jgi:hypothetical protein